MTEQIQITHQPTPFKRRLLKRLRIAFFFALLNFVGLIILGNRNHFGIYAVIVVTFFGLVVIFQLKKDWLYVVSIESTLSDFTLIYHKGDVEHRISTALDNVNIRLKVTGGARPNYFIALMVLDKKLIIDDAFDWTFQEMKELFEFVKSAKKENLVHDEKICLYYISKRMQKDDSIKC